MSKTTSTSGIGMTESSDTAKLDPTQLTDALKDISKTVVKPIAGALSVPLSAIINNPDLKALVNSPEVRNGAAMIEVMGSQVVTSSLDALKQNLLNPAPNQGVPVPPPAAPSIQGKPTEAPAAPPVATSAKPMQAPAAPPAVPSNQGKLMEAPAAPPVATLAKPTQAPAAPPAVPSNQGKLMEAPAAPPVATLAKPTQAPAAPPVGALAKPTEAPAAPPAVPSNQGKLMEAPAAPPATRANLGQLPIPPKLAPANPNQGSVNLPKGQGR